MVSITITEKGGTPQTRQFNQAEITIGRVQGNDIVLPKSNISKRHARFYRSGTSWMVADAKSTNGTYLNGKRLAQATEVALDDKVFIGDFTLQVRADAKASAETPPPRPRTGEERRESHTASLSQQEAGLGRGPQATGVLTGELPMDEWDHGLPADEEPNESRPTAGLAGTEPRAGKSAGHSARPTVHTNEPQAVDLPEEMGELIAQVHRHLRTLPPSQAPLGERVRAIVAHMQQEQLIPDGVEPQLIVDCVLSEAEGLGPLQGLLEDPSITEVLVNNAKQIYVERAGKLELSDLVFSSNAAVMDVIQRIVTPLGRHIDHRSPMVDARLRDGSRVHAIVPPLAVRGPTLTIRKFSREPLQLDDLVANGALNADMAEFLETCVKARRSIVVSGGTSSGKTTLLNVLSSFVGVHERIITIEDAAELKLEQAHVVSLESRPAGPDGTGLIGIRELVRNALRMRPDRIIVGECRGQEALDMLQAMNTGHEGSMTTVHANTPRDALSRLETMVLMGGSDVPARAIRDQVASAVDIIVQQSRFPDGSRRLTHISEITGMEGEIISMHDLFVYEQQGYGVDKRVQGRFRATGVIPKFYEALRQQGQKVDLGIFRHG